MATSLLSAIIGLTQLDLKRVVAFSTGSQLGLITSALGVSNIAPTFSLHHLLIHAFFKAGLFISCGCILHMVYNMQDIRHMGISRYPYILPTIFTVTGLSLIALPMISGNYRKEYILISMYTYSSTYRISFYICNLTSMFSAWYSICILIYLFIIPPTIPSLYMKIPNFNYSPITEVRLLIIFTIMVFSGVYQIGRAHV